MTPSVFLFFSQAIPVLVATLSSIHSDNLSLFDAHFAAAVTASPIAIYIVASSLRYPFCKEEPLLFTKISSREAKVLICMMGGIIFPCLWLSVSLVTSFSSTAFRNSSYCEGMDLPRYMEFLFASSFTGVLGRRDLWDDFSKRRGLGFISLIWLLHLVVYLVHHREKIIEICMAPIVELKAEKHSRGMWRWQLAKEYILLGWRLPMESW